MEQGLRGVEAPFAFYSGGWRPPSHSILGGGGPLRILFWPQVGNQAQLALCAVQPARPKTHRAAGAAATGQEAGSTHQTLEQMNRSSLRTSPADKARSSAYPTCAGAAGQELLARAK